MEFHLKQATCCVAQIWESRELWQKHMSGEAIEKFNQKISEGIIEFELQQMSQIA